MQATFQVNQNKNAEVTSMLCVGVGVWIAFKMDSILRLYNAASFAHMQDLNIAPSIQKILGRYLQHVKIFPDIYNYLILPHKYPRTSVSLININQCQRK